MVNPRHRFFAKVARSLGTLQRIAARSSTITIKKRGISLKNVTCGLRIAKVKVFILLFNPMQLLSPLLML